jgi:F0F1-type ATP synthase membrane subunit b/b'
MRRLIAASFLTAMLAAPATAFAVEAAEGEHHGVAPINWFEWHKGKYIHEGEFVSQQVSPKDEPMPPALIFALANFSIFAFVLFRYAGPVVKKYTRERHDSVRDALEEGARLRAEAKTKLAEYTDRIKGVEKEVDQLIADIRATAESERKQILAQAEAQATALRAEAEQRIAAELDVAKLELQREVMLAAIAIAEKMVREKSGPADQQKQFDAFLADLERSAGKEARS